MEVDIIDGDDAVFRASAYGLPDRESLSRSYERLEEYGRSLSTRASNFLGHAKKALDKLHDPSIKRALRRLSSSRRGLFRNNTIQFLDEQLEIAQAPEIMRRWLVAHPRLHRLNLNQRINAWGSKPNTYDLGPVHEPDRYYKAATNGLAKETEDGSWVTEYEVGACFVDGDTIDLIEQCDIVATYNVIDDLLDQGIDPTSPEGEGLF